MLFTRERYALLLNDPYLSGTAFNDGLIDAKRKIEKARAKKELAEALVGPLEGYDNSIQKKCRDVEIVRSDGSTYWGGNLAINMKKILGIVVLGLCLITPSLADDISDFEIEGMSIGDSLLDYYSKKEIKNATKNFYTGSKDFFELSFLSPKSDSYTQITFTLKRDDKNYIINAIAGIIFPYEIKSCNIKKAEIIDELNSVFENARKKNYDYTYTKLADGKSVAEITDFILDDGSAVRVYCTDWSKATEEMKSTNYNDMLSVDITSKLIMDWLRNEAY